ncbi:MAG TPA: AbrB family transcriptional regulator, partial [Firmicutes bacterium]|nr:AbrB family transcriptional regulator [Bacillota bacterium]HBK60700.1 AbrB family transcriptional regulator [Bacillota bacterium]
PACIFCGNADGIRIFKDKNICKECFDLMKSVG